MNLRDKRKNTHLLHVIKLNVKPERTPAVFMKNSIKITYKIIPGSTMMKPGVLTLVP